MDYQNKDARSMRIAHTWPILIALGLVVAGGAWLALAMDRRLDAQDALLRSLAERLEPPAPGASAGPATASIRGPRPVMSETAALLAQPGSEASRPDTAQIAQKARERQRRFANGFATSPQDPGAARVEIGMLSAMENPQLNVIGIAPRDPDVDCRRDMCKVSATFRNQAEASDWSIYYLTSLTPGLLGGAEPSITRNPDGSVQLALYAERKSTQ